ncbi:hypothetical protein EGI22_13645 [Lacihabitans sp. LS3-19]|uniref:3-coathanger stack domain-containing protein n=1 Tax=Lacihabitans sp. LS3-19 TaxID=2487335 RepID=UPI0020CE210E|nr:3-coathanger stack domain-containing protein [Lacihabitans sp. LS3-19]MCP9768958.1 hypothetical protein [Lacihabitans sp. LS3-19]
MKKIYLFFVLLGVSSLLKAQTKTWAGTTTDWNADGNWSPSGVPTSTDDVIINTSTFNPVINSGSFSVRSVQLTVIGSMLTVNSLATLNISTDNGNAIYISRGTFNNNGTLIATNTNPINATDNDVIRMVNSGIFNNSGTATLTNGDNPVINVLTGAFNNLTNGVVNASGRDVVRMGNSGSGFTNNAGATFTGTGTNIGLFMQPGVFKNYGYLELVGQVEMYNATSTFNNYACGTMKVTGNFFNQTSATSTNAGSLQILGNLNNNGSFTNNGVLKANAYPTYTNRRLQINNNAANNALFTISTLAGSTTINGIFFDQAATISAGTYASNTFTPVAMPGGVFTLYVKVTQSTCTYVVPFSYTRSRSRWYVKTVASGSGDGTSWADASGNLQAVINGTVPYDSVWVASGVYKPNADATGNTSPANARQKVFFMKTALKLFGGFAGTESSLNERDFKTNKTIFSGDIDNNDTNTDGNNIAEISTDIQGNNVYQLLVIANCDKNTLVDGITLTAAKSNTTTSPSQTINGVNVTPDLGSAINITASFPTIQNCVFSGNYGGFFGNVYQNNLSTPYIDTVKVLSSIFIGNYAQYGGGMFIRRGHHYSNNIVMNNNTSEYGGAIIVQNNMSSTGTIDFVNSTFVNNYSTYGKSLKIDAGKFKIVNSIVYNSVPYAGGNFTSTGGTITSSFSILQNSLTSAIWNNNYGTDGGNNLDVDPLFLNITDIDGADNKLFTSDDGLSLTLCLTPSPGLNVGTNTGIAMSDITDSPRLFGNLVDVGAYEMQQNVVGTNLNLTATLSGNAIYASSNTIVATNTMQSSANIKYLANNSISLNPQNGSGFTVNSGAVFEAKITPLTGCN